MKTIGIKSEFENVSESTPTEFRFKIFCFVSMHGWDTAEEELGYIGPEQ